MTPYYQDDWLTVYQGDCREVMAAMEPESVHCVVTSPPYWGLRDYGTATWLGGDEDCDHMRPIVGKNATSTLNAARAEDGTLIGKSQPSGTQQYAGECRKCGAVRQDSQLGLEPTPEEYVTNMVAVFREVRRVLRADGTVWLNLGDSYANGPPSGTAGQWNGSSPLGANRNAEATVKALQQVKRPAGLKPKDLVGIPWRVAFALQADGWYLRSDIIWSKPNPMPESVTDRPTKAHEYLFLLSKSARYYYDADAVREPSLDTGGNGAFFGRQGGSPRYGEALAAMGSPGTTEPHPYGTGRNLRSVWSIATQPYPGAHFATFPEALVEPCVKAGTSERGGCPECGAPWVRVTERAVEFTSGSGRAGNPPSGKNGNDYEQATSGSYDVRMGPSVRSTTTGWRQDCMCHTIMAPPPLPATVLDPFAGSGTTGRVAQRLGRRAVLIDLSGEYLTQAMRRNQDIPLGLESA